MLHGAEDVVIDVVGPYSDTVEPLSMFAVLTFDGGAMLSIVSCASLRGCAAMDCRRFLARCSCLECGCWRTRAASPLPSPLAQTAIDTPNTSDSCTPRCNASRHASIPPQNFLEGSDGPGGSPTRPDPSPAALHFVPGAWSTKRRLTDHP